MGAPIETRRQIKPSAVEDAADAMARSATTIEYVEKGKDFTYGKEMLLACSLGLNVGFLIALLFL